MSRLRISPDTLEVLDLGGLGASLRQSDTHGYFDREADLLGIVVRRSGSNGYGFVLLTGKGPLRHRWEFVDIGNRYPTVADADEALRRAMDGTAASSP